MIKIIVNPLPTVKKYSLVKLFFFMFSGIRKDPYPKFSGPNTCIISTFFISLFSGSLD